MPFGLIATKGPGDEASASFEIQGYDLHGKFFHVSFTSFDQVWYLLSDTLWFAGCRLFRDSGFGPGADYSIQDAALYNAVSVPLSLGGSEAGTTRLVGV